MLSLELLLFLYRTNKQTLYLQTVSLDLIFSSYSWEERQQAHVPECCTVLLKYCFFLAFLSFPICISLISLLLPHPGKWMCTLMRIHSMHKFSLLLCRCQWRDLPGQLSCLDVRSCWRHSCSGLNPTFSTGLLFYCCATCEPLNAFFSISPIAWQSWILRMLLMRNKPLCPFPLLFLLRSQLHVVSW